MEDGLIQLLVSTNRELPDGYRLPPSVQNPQLPNPQFKFFLRQQDEGYDGGGNGYDSSHHDAMVYNDDNINDNDDNGDDDYDNDNIPNTDATPMNTIRWLYGVGFFVTTINNYTLFFDVFGG